MTAFWRDLIERVAATFVEAFVAVLLASGAGLDWSVLKKAGLAGAVAAVALAKTLVARQVGSSNSASLDRANPGPVAPLLTRRHSRER